MALFGHARDISVFRHMNRELIHDIISQQCAFYKVNLEQTKTNIYGESSGVKFYDGPYIFDCLLLRNPKTQNQITDLGLTDFQWDTEFRFLRDDLTLNKVVPEIGDIMYYEEGFYETINVSDNQYFVGKDPDYPNGGNPLNAQLDAFGWNTGIVCKTVYVPADKVGIDVKKHRM